MLTFQGIEHVWGKTMRLSPKPMSSVHLVYTNPNWVVQSPMCSVEYRTADLYGPQAGLFNHYMVCVEYQTADMYGSKL